MRLQASEIIFWTNSLKTTDVNNGTIEGFETIYYELDGTKVNLFTRATDIQVDYLAYFFEGFSSLERIDISSWRTQNVVDFQNLFRHCFSLKDINLGNLDTSNGECFQRMFDDCVNLERIDGISNIDTHNATNMVCMFRNCVKLAALDLSNFDT